MAFSLQLVDACRISMADSIPQFHAIDSVDAYNLSGDYLIVHIPHICIPNYYYEGQLGVHCLESSVSLPSRSCVSLLPGDGCEGDSDLEQLHMPAPFPRVPRLFSLAQS